MAGIVHVRIGYSLTVHGNDPAEQLLIQTLARQAVHKHERALRQELTDLNGGVEPYRDVDVYLEA